MASVCSVAMASRVCPARWCYNSSSIHAGHWGELKGLKFTTLQALIYQVDFVGRGLEMCEYVWSVVVLGLIHQIHRGLPAYISWHQLTPADISWQDLNSLLIRESEALREAHHGTLATLVLDFKEVPSNFGPSNFQSGEILHWNYWNSMGLGPVLWDVFCHDFQAARRIMMNHCRLWVGLKIDQTVQTNLSEPLPVSSGRVDGKRKLSTVRRPKS